MCCYNLYDLNTHVGFYTFSCRTLNDKKLIVTVVVLNTKKLRIDYVTNILSKLLSKAIPSLFKCSKKPKIYEKFEFERFLLHFDI